MKKIIVCPFCGGTNTEDLLVDYWCNDCDRDFIEPVRSTECHTPQVNCKAMDGNGDCRIKLQSKKIKEEVDYFKINMTVGN